MRYSLLGLAVLLLPALAHADRLRVTSYDMDDGGGTVRVEADAPLGEPWLRIEGRTIKIWFPHVQEVARFDHERGGSEPIRALQLRSGASETALLKVDLGANHAISRDDIAITREGLQAAVKLRVPTAQPTVPVQPPTAAAAPAAAAAPLVAPAPAPAPAAPAPAAQAAKSSETQTQAATSAGNASTLGLGAANDGSGEDELGAQDEDSERTSPIWLLGAASVLLAFVYFGLQHLQRSKASHSPSIEIVGTRRLGPKQELLIVRALGADHLLLCTNGRAERVASTPSAAAPAPLALPASTAPTHHDESQKSKSPSQAGGIGLMSRLSSQHRLRKLLDSVGADAPPANDGDAEAPTDDDFGNELRTATRQRSALLHSIPAPAARQSESVAGITRLRQRR